MTHQISISTRKLTKYLLNVSTPIFLICTENENFHLKERKEITNLSSLMDLDNQVEIKTDFIHSP